MTGVIGLSDVEVFVTCSIDASFPCCFQKPPPPLIPDMETKVPRVEDTTFNFMREEGIMFAVPTPGGTARYWVVG